MDDIRSLREQRDELAGKINDVLLRNDSIEDAESIELLEKGEQQLAELDTQIRGAEARAKAEERLAKPSFGFTPSPGSASREDSEYRFEVNGTEIRVVGGNTVGANGPTTGFSGDYGASIPVDLSAEMVRQLPKLAPIRGFFGSRSYANDIELQRVAQRITMATDANVIGESAAYPNEDMVFERIRVRSFKTAAKSSVTEEFLRDARGNAVGELLLEHAEEHGRLWDTLYASSAGDVYGPEPCMLSPDSWAVVFDVAAGNAAGTTAGTAAPHADIAIQEIDNSDFTAAATTEQEKSEMIIAALTELRYDKIPAQYWGGLKWLVTQEFFAQIAARVDGNGRPLFQPFVNSTPANSTAAGTLLGLPVTVTNNREGKIGDTASTTLALLSHTEDYGIFDRKGFSQQVDPFSRGDNGEVVYRTRMRSDARWLRPFASGMLVTKA